MIKPDIIQQIKTDLNYAAQDGYVDEVGYKLLDDGTLCVQTFKDNGYIDKTYIVNISLGRELEPAEWQEP